MAGTEGNLGSQGIIWQPSHVFDEIHLGHERSQDHRNRINYLNAETIVPLHYKCSSKVPNYRPRPYANMAPGMPAVYVDSDRKSGGTGVFLPRRAAKELQPTKKPVPLYAPVLMPTRIVQTLNVNVSELGIQRSSPSTDIKDKPKTGIQITRKNKDDGKDGSTEVWGMSEKLSPSPETYLPKEWTY